jgi:hypothetical protein
LPAMPAGFGCCCSTGTPQHCAGAWRKMREEDADVTWHILVLKAKVSLIMGHTAH